jgi:hypothetical protein
VVWWVVIAVWTGIAGAADPAVPSGPESSEASSDIEPFSWTFSPPVLAPGASGTLQLRMRLPEGFEAYVERLRVEVAEPGPLTVHRLVLPEGRVVVHDDDKGPHRVVDHEVVVSVDLQAPLVASDTLAPIRFEIEHQGCFQGRCVPAQVQVVTAYVPIREALEVSETCAPAPD